MHLVMQRHIFLPIPWHEAGSCQVKVAGRIPRDRAWAMGWTEEQLPSHYFIVGWLLGTRADMQNQSKNYYCQGSDTNGSDSVQSSSVFQGQSPQFSSPASSCINPLGRWLELCFLNWWRWVIYFNNGLRARWINHCHSREEEESIYRSITTYASRVKTKIARKAKIPKFFSPL